MSIVVTVVMPPVPMVTKMSNVTATKKSDVLVKNGLDYSRLVTRFRMASAFSLV